MSDNRMLATIEQIGEISPIEGADSIVRARVRGWDVVVKIDEFQTGDTCVYFEVDSLLDVTDERFTFLALRGVRTDSDGRSGHVLKTARLRGQYSQGLALPTSSFPELGAVDTARLGEDVTDLLKVVKWDPPIPAELLGSVRGMRPSWIPATAETRLQNLQDLLAVRDVRWEATEKIDGSSTTFWSADGERGVCSRNLDLLPNSDNKLWQQAERLDVHVQLESSFPGARVALQGEIYGQGVPPNSLRLKEQGFAAFTLRVDGVEIPRGEWPTWLQEISVPVHELSFPETLEDALAQVEHLKSKLAPERAAEGVVWRASDRESVVLADGRTTRASFKVISNRYLMKNDR